MGNILIGIEIVRVGGVIAVIVFYLDMKRKLRNKNEKERNAKSVGTMDELKSGKG